MSLVMLNAWEEEEEEVEEEEVVFFFFISRIFPRGKEGFGPGNPFALSFRYAKLGKIQKMYAALKRMTKRRAATAMKKG